jgi:hypothetical protein
VASEHDDVATTKFRPPRVALGVGLDEATLEKCTAILAIPVLKAAHTNGACQRMLTTRPLVVIVARGLSTADLAEIHSSALATGAQVVALSDVKDESKLAVHLKAALRAALLSQGQA